MKDEDFQKLLLGVKQMGAIMKGESKAHRRTTLEQVNVKSVREHAQMQPTDFARMIGVSVNTLQKWEQGRSQPSEPAKRLLRLVDHNPQLVLKTLSA